MAQGAESLTGNHEDASWIPGLAKWVRIRHWSKVQCRSRMQLGYGIVVAAAPIWELVWEPPCAVGEALLKKKKQQQKKTNSYNKKRILENIQDWSTFLDVCTVIL